MAKKVKKGQFWITRIGEIGEVKSVYCGNVTVQAYSRQGTPKDGYETFPIKDLLEVSRPCCVVKSQYIDENGNVMYKTVEYLEVK